MEITLTILFFQKSIPGTEKNHYSSKVQNQTGKNIKERKCQILSVN